MDTGKIVIGIALIMFSAALIVHPTSAYGFGAQRGGCVTYSSSGSVIAPEMMHSPPLPEETGSITGLPTVLTTNGEYLILDFRIR